MNEKLTLRPATILDADILLRWRNDPDTQKASHSKAEISWEQHATWLEKILADSKVELLIAEKNGQAVGTVRANSSNKVVELSWTVAPEARGCGIAKQMVTLAADRISGAIRAEVKAGNIASARVAESVGMTLSREKDGVMYYRRET